VFVPVPAGREDGEPRLGDVQQLGDRTVLRVVVRREEDVDRLAEVRSKAGGDLLGDLLLDVTREEGVDAVDAQEVGGPKRSRPAWRRRRICRLAG
jgi:hypothetical protein